MSHYGYGYDRITGEKFASRSEVIVQNGMVATSHPLATQIGLDVLKQGGTAVDAAIAANIALGLMEPTGNGIGGDLFAIVWDVKTKKLHGLNASGPAPKNISIEYFLEKGLSKIPAYGPLPVTVPGAVDGWVKLHEKFGKLEFKSLFEPTIKYANEGFPVTELIAYYLDRSKERFKDYPNFKEVWMKNGKMPEKGEIFKNPQLAKTLEIIAEKGRDGFYDEWADFEIMPFKVATQSFSEPKGSYVRDALLEGIKMEQTEGFNPYKFGLIGSSDSHTAASSQEEDNFFSKVGLLDSSAALRGSIPVTDPAMLASGQLFEEVDGNQYMNSSSITWGAAGLAGVWAEENTRNSIYDAFRRKESFATTGPRMTIRFFAGYDMDVKKINDSDLIEYLYSNAKTMGADLDGVGQQTPSFFVWAVRDTFTAPLQRVQIIKGFVDENGDPQEQVFDVACSDGGVPDSDTYRCPDNNAKVDISTCEFSQDVGAAELKTFWNDPTFKIEQRAFYYVRAMENPTCRWSTWDAIRNNVEPRSDMPKTIQERVWSSPIHYIP